METERESPLRSIPRLELQEQEWEEIVRELRLTTRQAAIVDLILKSKKDQQIAADLGLSPSTVRMHLRNIYLQLNLTDRTELVLRTFEILRR